MNFTSSGFARPCVLVGALMLTACPPDQAMTSATGTTVVDSETSGGTSGGPTSGPTATTDEPTGGTTGTTGTTGDDPSTGSTDTSDDTGDTGDTTGLIPVPEMCEDMPVAPCDGPITKCNADRDADQRQFTCDNAPDHHNPDQQDLDGDGFGDIIDLCPTIASDGNTLDADKDGIGNACDLCPFPKNVYNESPVVPFYMRVRGIPNMGDADGDGVGDACDNCVRLANCQDYGDAPGLTPFKVGMPIDYKAADCQSDVFDDDIGEACFGQMLPGAAGKVGYADDDDFDQDGVVNIEDGCPRLPVARRTCKSDGDCPDGARCADSGVCNHVDHDGDGVGDICDTCPDVANPEQVTEEGAALDDPDGDFIGTACEQNSECVDRFNPRRHAFYDVSVGGRCCTTVFDGRPLLDPDGVELSIDALGPRPAGTFELPAGCEEALAASEDGKAHRIEWCNVADPADLYQYFCLLPTWDQDYDAVPDECDLCLHAHDPLNQPYVDANNKEWPNYGKYCNGDYSYDQLDPAQMCAQGS